MSFGKAELEAMARSVPFWFHSIDFGEGVVTNGWKSASHLEYEIDSFRLPDLRGKTVLDINTWDGFYAFEAERRGAARVVALDLYMWAMDPIPHHNYWKECRERDLVPEAYHTMPYYKPDELPGKAGFDTAHRALGSKVEVVVADFMEMDVATLGLFDVVFYFGSLYHMENPLGAMKRVAAVTKELAIIETEAASFQGLDEHALYEFFPSNELNNDVSNWWAPNEKALAGLCRAAGFSRVESVVGPSLVPEMDRPPVTRYRSVVHAWK
jgi:tRNA (mo5U34)-methyltransferase